MKRAAAAAVVLAALSGCIAPPQSGPKSRKLTYGLFYDFFRPDSSKEAELQRRLDRPVAPEIDEKFDVSLIRAPRQYSEFIENYELRDWKDSVLDRADAPLLHKMRADTAGKVGELEMKIAEINSEPESLRKGRIELVRQRLDIEKTKLAEIDDKLRHLQG